MNWGLLQRMMSKVMPLSHRLGFYLLLPLDSIFVLLISKFVLELASIQNLPQYLVQKPSFLFFIFENSANEHNI
jgi:hypothetical protein